MLLTYFLFDFLLVLIKVNCLSKRAMLARGGDKNNFKVLANSEFDLFSMKLGGSVFSSASRVNNFLVCI